MKAEEPIEEAKPPLAWAAQTAERLNCTCKSVQAFLRLINGGLGAFHTLLALAPTYGSDPVAILLGSSMGLGVIAACLQPGRLSAEYGGTIARYAAALLVRVLSSSRGAAVSEEEGKWLGSSQS